MKSETQNIYNFCMEKKKEKNVKQKNMRKWKLFFIVLAKEEAPGKKKSSQKKYRHFLHL